jgi:outer membrane protein OmpA-like peptidoglycan-associated protein
MKMKTMLVAPLLLALGAGSAVAGGDFTAPADAPRPLAASQSNKLIQPQDDVVFVNDSSALMDSGVEQVNRIAQYLHKHPKMRIVVEGHTNSAGKFAHNEQLATARADMVREHLIGSGIKSDRILVLVYGESGADKRPSPTDRRVVVYATAEAPTTVARRELNRGLVLSATYTRGRSLVTETGGNGKAHVTLTEQVARK